MKAFLSHSSKDKYSFARLLVSWEQDRLSNDAHTLEFGLNVENIRRTLSRCQLFVLFLSANSIGSSFVSEKQRAALEARGKGFIKQVLIIAIDRTSYRDLPAWLHDINIVQQLSSPKTAARRIQSALIALEAEEYRDVELYIGRADEEKALRRALSAPPNHYTSRPPRRRPPWHRPAHIPQKVPGRDIPSHLRQLYSDRPR
jgi:hypothetical protein